MKQESNLCLVCLSGLPKTYYWDYDITPVEKLFYGKVQISSACSFLHFEQGTVVQRLIHRLKYEGKSNIGYELGKTFAIILKDKKWFADADVIIPIPLHATKQLRRGYNQSAFIADGIGEIVGVKIRNHALKRTIASSSQTRKSRYDRAENVQRVFELDKQHSVIGKNVLLVDDVVTTGATLESAARCLLEAGANKIYIATLASTM